jgi:hypothetical protein
MGREGRERRRYVARSGLREEGERREKLPQQKKTGRAGEWE